MAAKKKKTKAVATQGPSAPALVGMMEEHAGRGQENVTSDDMKTPMAYIAQTNSPCVDKGSDQYIAGVEVGDFYNTVSREWTSQLPIVPCYFRVRTLEWTPRNQGGGLVAVHDGRDVLERADGKDDRGRPTLNGNELRETAEFLCLADFGDGWKPCLVPLGGSGWTAARTLNTMIAEWRPEGWATASPPPSYGRVYMLSTERKENDDGVWQRATVTPGNPISDEQLFAEAVRFYELCNTEKIEGIRDEAADQGGDDTVY